MRGEFGHGGRHCSPTCPSEGHSITLDSMDFGMAQPPGGGADPYGWPGPVECVAAGFSTQILQSVRRCQLERIARGPQHFKDTQLCPDDDSDVQLRPCS